MLRNRDVYSGHKENKRVSGMNPYQVMGGIACCTLIFAGVVAFLTVQGVPLLVAFLSVYLLAIWVMMGMQRRARQLFEENSGIQHQRRHERGVQLRSDVESNALAAHNANGIAQLNDAVDADSPFGSHSHLQA